MKKKYVAKKTVRKNNREAFAFGYGKHYTKSGNDATKPYYVADSGELKNFSYDLGGGTDKQHQFSRNLYYD